MNLKQLNKDFGTQKKCITYLEKIRWGKEPFCAYANLQTFQNVLTVCVGIAIVAEKIIAY